MNVLEAVARQHVLYQLAQAHDHWSEEEQLFVGKDRPIEAAGAHQMALMTLRAYRAELDDPQPKDDE